MNDTGQIHYYWSSGSDLARVGIIVVGCLLLYVALKIGGFILKLLLGLAGLAIIAGAIYWLLLNHR